MPAKNAPTTLEGNAANIWESAYESAWKAYDKNKHSGSQEEYAAKTAWAAVKNAGYTKEDDKWIKTKSFGAQRLQLRFTKAKFDNASGRIRWHAQAANDELDKDSGEVLDPSLFTDLADTFLRIRAAYDNQLIPPTYWFGKAKEPILDLSHYSALLTEEDRDAARLGVITKLYRDGRYLHASGYFDDSDMGRLAARSIMNDNEGVIRCSVGFWPDWGNVIIDENDNVRFMGGRGQAVLDHLAVTSVPRIKSTSIFAEGVTMSDGKVTTMADDARAILGEDGGPTVDKLEQLITDGLETRSMVLRGDADTDTATDTDTVVESADETDESEAEPQIVEAAPVESEQPVVAAKTVKKPDFSKDDKDKEKDMEDEDEDEDKDKDKDTDEKDKKDKKDKKKSDFADEGSYAVSRPFGGATSFDAAMEQQQAIKESWRLSDGWGILQTVIQNIFSDPDVQNKQEALATAMAQYTNFIKSDTEVWSAVISGDVEQVETTPVEALPVNTEVVGLEDVSTDPAVAAAALNALKDAVGAGEVAQDGVVNDIVADEVGTDVEVTQAVPVPDTPVTNAPVIDSAATAPVSGAIPAMQEIDASEAQVGVGYRRESTFSGVLQGLADKGRQVTRRSAPPAFSMVSQPTEVVESTQAAPAAFSNVGELTPDLVETLVSQQVQVAMRPVLEALSQLQSALTVSGEPVVNARTPQRPERRSVAPVQPARQTTRAKTFGEALDSLLAQR